MGLPQESLPERKDEILAPGARLRIILKERSGEREVEIVGNRKGLLALAVRRLISDLAGFGVSACWEEE
jgi:hypothetical protein